MTRYLFLTTVIFMLSLAALSLIVSQVDPFGPQKTFAFSTFFVAVFLAMSSFFTFLFFFTKELFSKEDLGHRYYLISMRRGSLIGFSFVALIAMHLLRILTIFEATLLIIFLVLLELSFITNKN